MGEIELGIPCGKILHSAKFSRKQNRRTKQYYYENKEQVLKQQREYQDKKSPFEKSKIKMLYYLNSDPDYHTEMKEKTQQKYNLKKVNGRWV